METSNGKIVLIFFPQSISLLQQEIMEHHQDLVLKLADVYPMTMENQLAKLGAELDIILDGDYNIGELCEMLLNQLRRRRKAEVIIPSSGGFLPDYTE